VSCTAAEETRLWASSLLYVSVNRGAETSRSNRQIVGSWRDQSLSNRDCVLRSVLSLPHRILWNLISG
jgi:hypothetical protein